MIFSSEVELEGLGLPQIILENEGSFVLVDSVIEPAPVTGTFEPDREVNSIRFLRMLLIALSSVLRSDSAKSLTGILSSMFDCSVSLVVRFDVEDKLLSSSWVRKSGVCGGGEVTD